MPSSGQRNELEAIDVCRAIVDAQKDYFAMTAASGPKTGSGVYAAKFLSTPGTHDGLYWPTKEGEPASPLGELVAEAQSEGYSPSSSSAPAPRPYHGYCYRILTAQADAAPGGARSYLAEGRMSEGFAVVAYPAAYGNSGIMTFIVGRAGVVFQRDLGPDTGKLAATMAAFDPDESWAVAK